MKFSDAVGSAKSADAVKDDAAKALDAATADAAAKHSVVVAALSTKAGKQAALPDPSGDVDEYGLNADGSDFTVTTIPGDFDLDVPPPAPEPVS